MWSEFSTDIALIDTFTDTHHQKVCITNMLAQAQSLGCSNEANITCLCDTPNFQYGVRDCIAQSCPAADATTVTTFGDSLCAGMLLHMTEI